MQVPVTILVGMGLFSLTIGLILGTISGFKIGYRACNIHLSPLVEALQQGLEALQNEGPMDEAEEAMLPQGSRINEVEK